MELKYPISKYFRDGSTLEEILGNLMDEIDERNERIKESEHALRYEVIRSNEVVSQYLQAAIRIDEAMYERLDIVEANNGQKNIDCRT